jgi:TatD DNase family protein
LQALILLPRMSDRLCQFPLSLSRFSIEMNLTDTHIHLYSEDFDTDRESLLEKAGAAGVQRMLMPNIDAGSVDGMFRLVDAYPGKCFAMMGLHPCYVNEDYRNQLSLIRKHLDENRDRIIAVGEIGLDFHWDLTWKKEQEEAFREQCRWAAEMKLPISIHSRNSTAELINILRDMNLPELTGVFHCFSGDINQADEIMNMGFYLGIGGVVTFKNSSLASIVRDVPLEFILLETDAPYLAPTPYRGKRNEPAYLRLIAEKIAEIKQLPLDKIAQITSLNAEKLFRI